MWCPKDYHSLNEVINRLFETAEDVLSLVARGGEPIDPNDEKLLIRQMAERYLRSHGFGSIEEDADLNVAITACFLLSKFLDDYPPILANIEGQFVRAEGVFFEHMDQLHLCPFGWPLKSQTEYAGYFEYAENGNFEPLMIFDRFAFIDTTTGEIRVKNGSRRFLTNFTHYGEDAVAKLMDLATRLSGFVVCWEDLPDEAEYRNFLSYLEVNDTFIRALDNIFGPAIEAEKTVDENPKRSVGRPSKKEAARKSYWKLFPDGHEAEKLTWKEVHRAVEDAGLYIEITTLKRAVREGGQKGQN